MAVIVGSARIDERGKAHGGKAGDNNGKEVSTQKWYKHSKGWRVIRPVNPVDAENIAKCMQMACDNNNIGYDQYQRLTLYNNANPYNFDCSKVTKACETDCSALVRVCMAYTGIMVENFRTTNQAKVMLATGKFVEMTGNKYTNQSDYLRRGDVLVTKVQGHTVVVMNDGDRVNEDPDVPPQEFELGDRTLRSGMTGTDVRELQEALKSLNYAVGEIDGNFGSKTEKAVINFQKSNSLESDGIYGPDTHAAMEKAIGDDGDPDVVPEEPDNDEGGSGDEDPAKDPDKYVLVTGNTVNVRTQPNTKGEIVMVASKGDELPYGGMTSLEGWHNVIAEGLSCWISGKYSEVKEYEQEEEIVPDDDDWKNDDDGRAIIDISTYQHIQDAELMSQHVKLCIHRASIGFKKDAKWDKHAQKMYDARIPYGVYHYVKSNNEKDAREEARVFFDSASKYNPLFYAADMEYSGIGKKNARAVCSAFIDELKKLGVEMTGIYVGHHLYKSWNLDYDQVDFTWIPRYGTKKQNLAGEPGKWPAYECTLHQYTSCGKIPGIKGRIDMNRITGKQLTYDELVRKA